jgi:hypothetical protein
MDGLLCAIHQPNFFPRLSTLAKLFTADIWIILDDVQFARRDFQHRCHLAPVGDDRLPERWLTVPVHLPSGRSTLIRDVQIAEPLPTLRRVTSLLHQYYRRSPYRAATCGLLSQVADAFTRTGKLTEVSEDSTRALLTAVNWRGAIYRSSDLPARPGRSERLADLTRAVGAAVPRPTSAVPAAPGISTRSHSPRTAWRSSVSRHRSIWLTAMWRAPASSPRSPTWPRSGRWRLLSSSGNTPAGRNSRSEPPTPRTSPARFTSAGKASLTACG